MIFLGLLLGVVSLLVRATFIPWRDYVDGRRARSLTLGFWWDTANFTATGKKRRAVVLLLLAGAVLLLIAEFAAAL